MRQPVRPFIKAYKNRSGKNRSIVAETSIENPFLEPERPSARSQDIVTAPAAHDEAYLAALRAADAIFGRAPAAPAAEPASSPAAAATGRVLPSLIEPEDPIAARLQEEPVVRRGRKKRAVDPDAPAPLPQRKARRPRKGVDETETTAPTFFDESFPTFEDAPQLDEIEDLGAETGIVEHVTGPRRPRRPIQRRWVLRSATKAGEKWKRRLRPRRNSED